MAMNETLQRSLTGLVYMLLILIGALVEKASVVVFLFFGLICLHEVQKLLKKRCFWGFVALVFAFLGVQLGYIENKHIIYLLPFFLVTNLILARDLFTKKDKLWGMNNVYLLSFGYIVPSFVMLLLIGNIYSSYQPEILVGFFFLLWSNDSFAYVFGKSMGKHKLFERISPKKTIEGFIGGLVMCLIFSQLIFYFYPTEISQVNWIGIAIIASIGGTIGDLIQSKLKRIAKVKDSGKIIPGHGGIFDRMDSTVFSITFVYIFLIISTYVS
jgi:phosphatidate cytidylyltransferase